MAKFAYTGRDTAGALTSGSIDAMDEQSAAKLLLARNITPVSIVAGELKTAAAAEGIHPWFTPNVTLDDLVIFSRQMYSLSKAGIPILRAVSGLAETSSSKRLKAALQDVINQLERGRSFSNALNQHPKIFNQLFVSVIHVGENTGRLDQAFLQLSEYLEGEQETRNQIKAATRYPVFVLIALCAAFVILNVFVIPKFADMFSKFGAELPIMTRFLLGTSDFVIRCWGWLLVLVVGGGYIGFRYLQTDNGRYRWDKRKLALPIVGSIFTRSLLGRFSRSFAMMLSAGVPLTTALNLVADAVNNRFMGQKIIEMRQRIEKGENLTRVAHASGLFTPMVLQMISVGEETGQVDELLAEVSEFYEREVSYDLKTLTARIEPVLIVLVAAMVLVLALGIFTPMWDMMSAIKGGR